MENDELLAKIMRHVIRYSEDEGYIFVGENGGKFWVTIDTRVTGLTEEEAHAIRAVMDWGTQ